MTGSSSLTVSEESLSSESARAATYPPPYPEGWYVVARDGDIGNRPRRVRCVGDDIVLFRGSEGRIHAIAAHCPHMGANLADGRVRDGCLECPFHGWRFAGDGELTGLPGGRRRTPGDAPLRGRWMSFTAGYASTTAMALLGAAERPVRWVAAHVG